MREPPLLSTFRALFRRKRVEQEMDEELQFHLECQIRDNIKNGDIMEDSYTVEPLIYTGDEGNLNLGMRFSYRY